MNYRVFVGQSSVCSAAWALLKRSARASRWPSVWLALILSISWFCTVTYADVLDIDLSRATVAGQVPIASQFLPNVVWINFYVNGQYAASSGGAAGTLNWNSTGVSDGVYNIEAVGFDAQGNISGYSNIRLSVANSSPSASPGTLAISGYADQAIWWTNLYVDGSYAQSSGSGSWSLSQSFTAGTHQIRVAGYYGNTLLEASAQVGNVNFGGSGSAANWSVPPGATISGLTGSASGIPGADTNPADYGNYWAWGDGFPLIGGPLLNDAQAASFVKSTPESYIELSIACGSCGIFTTPNGAGNSAANNYFNNIASTNPGNYQYQLQGFYAAYAGGSWQAEADRIDGACPIANPTTAEVLQWAANKWGINPLLMYAEAASESSWDQTGIGDNGGSSGLFQVADRNTVSQPNHAFPGFSGSGSNLARENSCFNADFFASWIYSTFNGLIPGVSGGDIGTAIQSWANLPVSSAGGYTAYVYTHLSESWWTVIFGGATIPY
jgi:hypothetical protein